MKKIKILLFTLIIGLTLVSCADVTNVNDCLPPSDHVYGFWGGVWHGMIIQFSFLGSLFSDDIAVYAVNNNGVWYNFGFVGGLGIIIKLVGFVLKNIKS